MLGLALIDLYQIRNLYIHPLRRYAKLGWFGGLGVIQVIGNITVRVIASYLSVNPHY